MNSKRIAEELVGVAKELSSGNQSAGNRRAGKKIKYKGYTIEESGLNYYITDPSGHRAFGETPADIKTAKKWIDMQLSENRRKRGRVLNRKAGSDEGK